MSKKLSVRVWKWRNSLAFRLPAEVVDALQLKEGDPDRTEDSRPSGVRDDPCPEPGSGDRATAKAQAPASRWFHVRPLCCQ
jgi:Antidote-toxin recognition MazE, bacterial antitoxin